MATQSQKVTAFSKLMFDPNTKLDAKYLENIKLAMTPTAKHKDLEHLDIIYTRFMSAKAVLYQQWIVDITNCTRQQIYCLRKIGFDPVDHRMVYSGFSGGFETDTPFWILIQNLKSEIEVRISSYDEVIFNFLSKVEHDDFLKNENTGARSVDCMSWDELQMVDGSLGIGSFLSHWSEGMLTYNYEEVFKVSAEQRGCTYILNITEDKTLSVVSDIPLTVRDILSQQEYVKIRKLILAHYLAGTIDNIITYKDMLVPEYIKPEPVIDPLITFNQTIDKLQSSNLSLNELAKELILLSAKHLE